MPDVSATTVGGIKDKNSVKLLLAEHFKEYKLRIETRKSGF